MNILQNYKMAIIIILAIVIPFVLLYVFPIVRVIGNSMLPTYKDGDILIGTRLFNKYKLQKGGVYVYKRYGKYIIKRLSHTKIYDMLSCWFLGDNPKESYDSRAYGYVNAKNIEAKILWQVKRNKGGNYNETEH